MAATGAIAATVAVAVEVDTTTAVDADAGTVAGIATAVVDVLLTAAMAGGEMAGAGCELTRAGPLAAPLAGGEADTDADAGAVFANTTVPLAAAVTALAAALAALAAALTALSAAATVTAAGSLSPCWQRARLS